MTVQLSFDFNAVGPKKAARVKTTPEERSEQRAREMRCVSCGMSWHDGCRSDHWATVDVGHIGMCACARCGKDVCHLCYARSDESHGVLCAACFALPGPRPADAAAHPLAASHGIDYAWRVIQETEWRYAAPGGQLCKIYPAQVWYWSVCSGWSGLSEGEFNRRYGICAYGDRPAKRDSDWCPAWVSADADSVAA